jgi:hypothetical protein
MKVRAAGPALFIQTNMKKNFLTLTLLTAASVASYAQTLAPAAVTSAATKMTQSNGSLSFTVGELVVQTQTDANGNTLGGGFKKSFGSGTKRTPRLRSYRLRSCVVNGRGQFLVL